MDQRVRVEGIRHAFQTRAPEPAREADPAPNTKGQWVLLEGKPSVDQEPQQPAQPMDTAPGHGATPGL